MRLKLEIKTPIGFYNTNMRPVLESKVGVSPKPYPLLR